MDCTSAPLTVADLEIKCAGLVGSFKGGVLAALLIESVELWKETVSTTQATERLRHERGRG